MPAALYYNDEGLYTGDIYVISPNGCEAGLGDTDTRAVLACIWDKYNNRFMNTDDWDTLETPTDNHYSLGMYCETTTKDYWCNLNGYCENYHGFWCEPSAALLYGYLTRIHKAGKKSMEDKTRYIKTDLIYKRRSLIGKKCRIIRPFKHSGQTSYFVEFEENIGGCSCDGLGKSGHCLPVSANFLVKSPKKVENVNEKYIEALKCISI